MFPPLVPTGTNLCLFAETRQDITHEEILHEAIFQARVVAGHVGDTHLPDNDIFSRQGGKLS